MNVHISYKLQRTPDIDKEMQHWTAKIQKRLQVFRPELIHLKGLLEQNSAREGITVSLNLRLPSGQMAAQESAPTPAAALKAAGSAVDPLRDAPFRRFHLNRPSLPFRQPRLAPRKFVRM